MFQGIRSVNFPFMYCLRFHNLSIFHLCSVQASTVLTLFWWYSVHGSIYGPVDIPFMFTLQFCLHFCLCYFFVLSTVFALFRPAMFCLRFVLFSVDVPPMFSLMFQQCSVYIPFMLCLCSRWYAGPITQTQNTISPKLNPSSPTPNYHLLLLSEPGKAKADQLPDWRQLPIWTSWSSVCEWRSFRIQILRFITWDK